MRNQSKTNYFIIYDKSQMFNLQCFKLKYSDREFNVFQFTEAAINKYFISINTRQFNKK